MWTETVLLTGSSSCGSSPVSRRSDSIGTAGFKSCVGGGWASVGTGQTASGGRVRHRHDGRAPRTAVDQQVRHPNLDTHLSSGCWKVGLNAIAMLNDDQFNDVWLPLRLSLSSVVRRPGPQNVTMLPLEVVCRRQCALASFSASA